jgi:hypothetical protein
VTVRITASGSQDFARLAHAFNEAGEKDLKKELDRGCREAGEVLIAAVRKNTDKYIPKHFEDEWRRSMRARVEVKLLQSRKASAVFWADGKTERRDIEAINAGRLKAPVHGRTRLITDGRRVKHPERIRGNLYFNPWHTQQIRPGLVDEPGAEAMPEAVGKLDNALTRVITKIESRP